MAAFWLSAIRRALRRPTATASLRRLRGRLAFSARRWTATDPESGRFSQPILRKLTSMNRRRLFRSLKTFVCGRTLARCAVRLNTIRLRSSPSGCSSMSRPTSRAFRRMAQDWVIDMRDARGHQQVMCRAPHKLRGQPVIDRLRHERGLFSILRILTVPGKYRQLLQDTNAVVELPKLKPCAFLFSMATDPTPLADTAIALLLAQRGLSVAAADDAWQVLLQVRGRADRGGGGRREGGGASRHPAACAGGVGERAAARGAPFACGGSVYADGAQHPPQAAAVARRAA
ncbi:hypothetical protein FB451DRAFT_1427 [Mycena latifolia]|nr:hypothetical protein FB451DRAFT_1427 [Mycena latifolia]